MLTFFITILTALFAVVDAISYTPLKPHSYPIAIRNPYLNAWLPGNAVANLPNSRAQFWTGAQLTWSVIARVDGTSYNLFGVQTPTANTQSATVISAGYTSSHTTFVVTAGDAEFCLEFFSPINPGDYVRQSLPFSYLTVSVAGVWNGVAANIEIYSDVDDSWNGQNMELFDQQSSWNMSVSGSSTIWQINHLNDAQYEEGGPNGQMAMWGSTIYATKPSSNSKLTTAAGPFESLRATFVKNGSLSGLGNSPPWAAGGVVAFSHDLGSVDAPSKVTFAIGFYRDCEVNYLNDCRVGYFRSEYNSPTSAATFFLDDYGMALSQSSILDTKIRNMAIGASGQAYADIIALSARQTFGGLDETIPAGTLDTNDHMVFLKEISSDGNVNTIDVIYPAFPQLYVLNAEYIRLLLEPVVRYLASGRWKKPFVIHDIGASYPKAIGHDDQNEEDQPVEETGNLLILAYIYTKVSGNTAWAAKYKSLFQGYADYLSANGLYPATQLSTDDAAGPAPNQTNLAIKAAVGLTSFGTLFGMSGYTDTGRQFATMIYDDGLGTDPAKTHFTLQYGQPDSWTTTFNLFPDYLMKLGTFNESAFAMQSNWYPKVRSTAGVALDSALDWAKTDWQLWAGVTSSASTMAMFVNDIHAYLSNGVNSVPFSDKYFVKAPDAPGAFDGYENRPVVGGEWCAMAVHGTN